MATLRRFVDTRSAAGWGAVANAFAAELRQLLSEWALFTAQLEHRALCGALPLQVIRLNVSSPPCALILLCMLLGAHAPL